MAFKVHHAVAKKAAKLNITLAPFDTDVVAQYAGIDVAFAKSATEALDKAINALTNGAGAPAQAIIAWAIANPTPAKKARKASDEDEGDDEEEIEDDEGDDGLNDGSDEADAEDEEGDEDNGKSKVKKKYKRQYRPTKNKNGDELSFLVTEHVAERNEDGTIAKPVRTDEEVLKRFANANGVWKPEYAKLNVGMRRMNIGNRLRSLVKHGHDIVWAK